MVGHRCHLLRGLHHPVTPNFLIKTVLNKDSLATLGRKDYFGEKRLFWGTLKQEQIQPVVFFFPGGRCRRKNMAWEALGESG